MHIGLISEEFPPETGWGGIGTYTYNMAPAHVANGHAVDVFTRTWEPERTYEEDGVRIHRLYMPDPLWRRGTRRVTAKMWETRHVLTWAHAAARAIRDVHRDDPFDVVETPEYHAQGIG